ncbi:MAG: hypothetical protein JNL21_06650 [Myxococcales bacterium]|nr:hypothetical protein [Myxococcales bacterium]
MSRITSVMLAAAWLLLGCGADPQSSSATGSVPTAPRSASTVATTARASAASSVVSAPSATALPAAGDPSTLLGGGAALEALPTRATAPGKSFDPRLRQRLMAPSRDPLAD